MARTPKRCCRCRTTCTDDHMRLTIGVTNGGLVLSYKPLYVCSEMCLREWADDTIWHADSDPRVAEVLHNAPAVDSDSTVHNGRNEAAE